MSDLPDRAKWNTPHKPEYAWDIAAEMPPWERKPIVAAWLSGDLKSRDEMNLHAACFSMWGTSRPTGPPSFNTYQLRDMGRALDAAWGEVADE